MPCLLFDCGLRNRCSSTPLNPCGVPMTNPFIRASALWFNQKYGNTYSAANPWVCNAVCLYIDYRVPGCCLPRKNYRIYHPEKRCCNDDDSSHHRSHDETSESHHHNKWYDKDSCSSFSKKDKKNDKKKDDKKHNKKDDKKKDDKKDKNESKTSTSKSTADCNSRTRSESYTYTDTSSTQ